MSKQQETFAARLARLMGEKGLTMYRLYQLSGVHQPAIRRYTRGEGEPTLKTAARLAAALGGDVEMWAGLAWPTKKEGKR